MSYKIFPTSKFEKELKRLVKKFPSLKTEFQKLIEQLAQAPDSGSFIGNDCLLNIHASIILFLCI
jgi:mRNA-degrading endonuclease RelE of RelBE toxin-antitoxin system